MKTMPRSIISMRAACLWVIFLCLFIIPAAYAESLEPVGELIISNFDPETGKRIIPNERCLTCHGDDKEKSDVRDDGSAVKIFVHREQIEASVHGKQRCNSCHITIDRVPHREAPEVIVGCIDCHNDTWEKHKDDPDGKHERLKVVNEQIDNFMQSIHAQPNKLDQSRTNATCYDCHDAHNVGELGSIQRAEKRLKNPEVCGRCHEKELDDYRTSDHGKAVLEKGDSESAVCSDCHTTHQIASPESDKAKLAITKNCGDCHKEAQRTYFDSYHGQVHRLGYTNTAKCHDCHGGHEVKGEDDPTSEIHANNRLENCRNCHTEANENFLTFWLHGDANDREKYPGLWFFKIFMQTLIFSVMAFFWVHVMLWLYREVMDRLQGKGFNEDVDHPDVLYFRRFPVVWRLFHGLFAISTMALILTGTTLIFSHTGWAKAVVVFLGSPQMEGIIHRTAAVIWLGIFIVHLLIAISNIWRKRETFEWFGCTSMLPNWKDWSDLKGMFKWFLGRGPRPEFSYWTYWQKFDYWAPFWGAAIIGTSGLMLFMPEKTALFLPGWMFNIATLVHAEEALLAAIFLNSVHFFNVHFRPERFPMSTTIFTGAIPIEEFKHDHRIQYERLLASGELEKCLVKRPSRRADLAASFITSVLIMAVLALLPATILAAPSGQALSFTCAGCHGTDGSSVGPSMPAIAGMDPEVFVDAMKAYRNKQSNSTIMNRIAKAYSDEQFKAMAWFFASQRLYLKPQVYDAALASRGAKLHDKHCEKCHENGGRPGDAGTLAGQWMPYLEFTMDDYLNGKRKWPRKMKRKVDAAIAEEGQDAVSTLIHYYGSQQ